MYGITSDTYLDVKDEAWHLGNARLDSPPRRLSLAHDTRCLTTARHEREGTDWKWAFARGIGQILMDKGPPRGSERHLANTNRQSNQRLGLGQHECVGAQAINCCDTADGRGFVWRERAISCL